MLADYHQRFRYMLVDEYQDTNVAQYLWLRLLAQGAAQHLLRRRRRPVDLRLARRRGRQHPALREGFSRRQGHPPRAQLPLDRHILGAASHLIAHNEGRLGKTLFTDARRPRRAARSPSPRRGTPRRRRAPSARRSSSSSAQGTALNEIAILVRASFQMRAFEDRFVTLGLNYRVIGGPRFYERAGNPRCARLFPRDRAARRRPRLRAHRQHAAPRHRRDDGEAAPRPRAARGACR